MYSKGSESLWSKNPTPALAQRAYSSERWFKGMITVTGRVQPALARRFTLYIAHSIKKEESCIRMAHEKPGLGQGCQHALIEGFRY